MRLVFVPNEFVRRRRVRIEKVEAWLAKPDLLEADKDAEYAAVFEIDLADIKEPSNNQEGFCASWLEMMADILPARVKNRFALQGVTLAYMTDPQVVQGAIYELVKRRGPNSREKGTDQTPLSPMQ